jgi:hypothetical protein
VPLFTKFERLDLSTDTTVQTVNLTINDVLQMTKDNTIANLLQVWGQSTDKLALTTWGIAANTVNPSTSLTDVDGVTTASVVADTNANGINEVTFAGRVYEVYNFDYAGSSINLLVQQAIVTGGGMTFVI